VQYERGFYSLKPKPKAPFTPATCQRNKQQLFALVLILQHSTIDSYM